MENYAYTHNIDETHRLVASHDCCNWSLEDILGDTLNIHTTRCSDRLCEINSGNLKDELKSVANRFHDEAHAVKLYLAIKGIAYTEITLRGYSQGEWHEVIIYNNEAGESSEWLNDRASFDELRAWYRGDVFRVESQQLETYANTRNGQTLERWETIDSTSGVILHDESNLALIAANCDLELTN